MEPDGVISTFAGNGRANYDEDGGLAINAGISPTSAAVDAAGNLYLAGGLSGRVRKVAAGTEIISTIAGNGVINTIPPGAALGAAMINVVNEGQVVAEGSVRIEAVAPGIFTANADGRGRPQWRWYETFGNKIGSPSGLSDSLRHGLDQMNVELPFFDLAGLGEVDWSWWWMAR